MRAFLNPGAFLNQMFKEQMVASESGNELQTVFFGDFVFNFLKLDIIAYTGTEMPHPLR